MIIYASKTKYSLLHLLKKLDLTKSSYYYHAKVFLQADMYFPEKNVYHNDFSIIYYLYHLFLGIPIRGVDLHLFKKS